MTIKTSSAAFSERNFMKSLLDKLKEETEKDKSMKESIKKFREETEKLEKSQELQNIREFYKKIEKEIPVDSMDKFKGHMDVVKKKIGEHAEQITQHDVVKKGVEAAMKVGSQVADTTKQLSEADIIKNTYAAIDNELVSDRARLYKSPTLLKTRSELAGKFQERVVEANDDARGIVLHKDSKWFNAWKEFKDNNTIAQKFFDFQNKLDESEHPLMNSFRFVKDKLSSVFGSSGSTNELQQTLDEISKMDPMFSLDGFLRFCRFDVIPNVLEAMNRGNLEVLKDWCHEAPFSALSMPIKQATELGLTFDNHILDINNVELQLGKIMDQGPMLLITFQTQQIYCLRNAKSGEVKEGDPSKILRINNVWALCRDQSALHPFSSWRILEIGMMPSEQWV